MLNPSVRINAGLLTALIAAGFLWAGAAWGSGAKSETEETGKKQYTPKEIIEKVDELLRGDSNYSLMAMTIYNPRWKKPRTFEMQGWEDRPGKKSFIRITAPARDRGKSFLKDGYVFKVYIPTERENKPITIPPSLMLQPWMGSDFTNDDLVRESSIVHDYEHTVEGVEKDETGRELVRVRLDPKPDAPVVWGKIVIWVTADEVIPVRQLFYDEDGKPIREFILSGIKEMGGRRLPTVWEMKSLEEDKKGRRTVIVIKKMEFNIPLDPKIFTDKNLTRRDWE